jgi:hypothetical protein
LRRRGKPIEPQTFAEGGEFRFSADDACIRKGLPCTHIVELEGEGYALCFVPRPSAVKEGMDWRELRFWVKD